jgi:hypothetical protein
MAVRKQQDVVIGRVVENGYPKRMYHTISETYQLFDFIECLYWTSYGYRRLPPNVKPITKRTDILNECDKREKHGHKIETLSKRG